MLPRGEIGIIPFTTPYCCDSVLTPITVTQVETSTGLQKDHKLDNTCCHKEGGTHVGKFSHHVSSEPSVCDTRIASSEPSVRATRKFVKNTSCQVFSGFDGAVGSGYSNPPCLNNLGGPPSIPTPSPPLCVEGSRVGASGPSRKVTRSGASNMLPPSQLPPTSVPKAPCTQPLLLSRGGSRQLVFTHLSLSLTY